MLSSSPTSPLCAASRLRHLCWLITLSMSGAVVAQNQDCPPDGGRLNTATQNANAAKRPPAGLQGGKVDVTADYATVGTNGDASLQGNVTVHQGDRDIHAEDIQYDGDDRSFKVNGKVEYSDPLLNVTGHDGIYSPTGGADFKAAQFEMKDRPGHGDAKALNLTPQGILKLKGVHFTTCPLNNESWQLSASSLTLDTANQLGSGRGTRVDFLGVPILYMPWASFPLGDQRKSGFLFPSGGRSQRSGFQATIPYYLNIAPNADFTLEPTYYEKRGLDYSGDTRFMSKSNKTEVVYHFLPNDDVALRDRSFVSLKDTTELPAAIRFRVDAANVSDNQYFQDFSQGPEGTSVAFVERLAGFSYRDENWRIGADAQQFQTITTTLVNTQLPYARVPRVVADADFGLGPSGIFRYGFESEAVDFQRNTGITGWRFDATPNIGLDFETPGFFFRPGVGWRYTAYQLDNVGAGLSSSPTRSLSVATVDTGLQFERASGARGQRTLTFEPRALYLRVPYVNQNNLPLFDTALPDLSLVQLFSTNRYVGADRVSDANQVSFGVTSRLLDATNGKQFIQGTFGQTVYIQAPRVTVPGEIARTSNTSDLIAELSLTAFKNWNINLGTQWTPSNTQTQRSNVNLQYRPANDQVVNLGYRFQRGTIEQSDVSVAMPVTNHWNLYTRFIYSMRDNVSLDRFAGLEYKACCWRMRLISRRFVRNNTGQQDSAVLLQLELNGLAGVGSAADAFLESAIRGYSADDTKLFGRQGY